MTEPVIQIEALAKRFRGVTAVDGLDLAVPRGSLFGLLGPNGAGKTTTLRILAGLLKPSAGRVRVFGLDPRRDPVAVGRRCGTMIEGPGFFPHLSGRRNLEALGRLKGWTGPGLRAEVDRLLAFAGIGEARDRPVRTYSTGMARKLGIALALLGTPELVILDEPTAGLDPASVAELRDALAEVRRSGTATLLISSHHLAEMETLCTEVAVVRAGRSLAQGPPRDLLGDAPALHRFVVDDAQRAAARLGGTPAGGAVELRCRPEEVPGAVRSLVEAGIGVFEAVPARSRLEEAYLRLTREGGAGGPPGS